MKKRSIAITMILTLLLMMFSAAAVLAEDDDHGADAHSESMSQVEEGVDNDAPQSVLDIVTEAVSGYVPYIIGAICGIVVIVIIVKVVQKSRRPKYTGKH
jgi:hypothetical protein